MSNRRTPPTPEKQAAAFCKEIGIDFSQLRESGEIKNGNCRLVLRTGNRQYEGILFREDFDGEMDDHIRISAYPIESNEECAWPSTAIFRPGRRAAFVNTTSEWRSKKGLVIEDIEGLFAGDYAPF